MGLRIFGSVGGKLFNDVAGNMFVLALEERWIDGDDDELDIRGFISYCCIAPAKHIGKAISLLVLC